MADGSTRRDFLKAATTAGIAAALGRSEAEAAEPVVRLGFVGVGARGTYLLSVLLNIPDVEIPAICDIDRQHLANAQLMVERAGHRRPDGYDSGPEDFRRLVLRDDLHGVITATPWEWHTPVMVAAMEAGKFGVTEVPAATTLAECWQLVDTAERTGMQCMMLENVCYYRSNMALLNMVRGGVFGEVIHAEAGYQHDVRDGAYFDPNGELLWRGMHTVRRNGSLYPTHGIGPVAHWMNINHGNRFTRLVSMSSQSRGLNVRIKKRYGDAHPNATRRYALGDVNTTLIQTAMGPTITLYHDTQSPRPYDLIFRLQGTEGIYLGTVNRIHLEGDASVYGAGALWNDPAKLMADYDHALWKKVGSTAAGFGHLGGDYMELLQLVEAIRNHTPAPIDVYDAATWSAIAPISEVSVALRSTSFAFPDFTRGRWKTSPPTFGVSI